MEAADAYRVVNEEITPEVIEFFKAKQGDYSGGPAFMFLGVKGQFADINRKFWKLYKALWKGEPLDGESAEEILMDFVGHCLLTIYALRQDAEQEQV